MAVAFCIPAGLGRAVAVLVWPAEGVLKSDGISAPAVLPTGERPLAFFADGGHIQAAEIGAVVAIGDFPHPIKNAASGWWTGIVTAIA